MGFFGALIGLVLMIVGLIIIWTVIFIPLGVILMGAGFCIFIKAIFFS